MPDRSFRNQREETLEYSVQDLERFLRFFKKNGGNITKAAKSAMFRKGRSEVKRLMQEIPWFNEAIEEIREEMLDDVEENVMRKAKRKLSAGKFVLTHYTRASTRGWRQRTELTGKDGGPLSWAEMMREHDPAVGMGVGGGMSEDGD